ncbi:hypothetical protein GCM10012320_08370 [Sinomonas cellulolyticus]|nr:hypothetical protein GCM10012320_08370 [Sinomonas sp. KCTC 49339]
MGTRNRTPRRSAGRPELHVVATAVLREQPDIPRLIRLLLEFARQHELDRKSPKQREATDEQS